MQKYAKTIVAALGAAATWGITAGADNAYSQAELWGALLAISTAVGVYLWPNEPAEDGQVSWPAIAAVLLAAILAVLLVAALDPDVAF